MARGPIDRSNPYDRRMLDDHARQRSRLSGEAGGIGPGSSFGGSHVSSGGRTYTPSAMLRDSWQQGYAMFTKDELLAERKALFDRSLRGFANEYERKISEMKRALVREFLDRL